jgi:hypothetical protein
MTRKLALFALVAAGGFWTTGGTQPNAATRNWWSHVRVLASDRLQGRDTGSEGYRRAAQYVVDQFVRAGLTPAGDTGFYQPVALHSVHFAAEKSSVELIRANGEVRPLQWQREIAIIPRVGIPDTFDAPLGFTGWETPASLVPGRILAALAPPRFVPGPRGYAQRPAPGYFGTLVIDSPAGPEPPRWPPFNSTMMSLAGTPLIAQAPGEPSGYEVNPAYAELLFEGSGHTYAELRAMADAGEHLPSFAMPSRLRGRITLETRDVTSDNVIAALKGADPILSSEYVVVSAHLDGWGVGAPVNGDRIYNGALDDAAYVATLIDFAAQLHATGRRFKRSILFCVFTAEERGLLGSQYFVAHPTVPRAQLVANVNLDALRPLFPLRSLTGLGIERSTLGQVARDVGSSMDITIKPDAEPDRNLLRRSDLWSFLQAGIPSLAFVFGYEPGSSEEAIYRRWYAQRYHSPSDDADQPWDPVAAARFNEFFARLVQTIADAQARPSMIEQPATSQRQ